MAELPLLSVTTQTNLPILVVPERIFVPEKNLVVAELGVIITIPFPLPLDSSCQRKLEYCPLPPPPRQVTGSLVTTISVGRETVTDPPPWLGTIPTSGNPGGGISTSAVPPLVVATYTSKIASVEAH